MSEARAYEPTVTRVKTVRVIPPTIQPLSDIPAFSARPRRVAAYARVSTSSEEQLTSYEAQVKHYTEYIKSKETSDNWQFVDVYHTHFLPTQEAIDSLTALFQQMREKALTVDRDMTVCNCEFRKEEESK